MKQKRWYRILTLALAVLLAGCGAVTPTPAPEAAEGGTLHLVNDPASEQMAGYAPESPLIDDTAALAGGDLEITPASIQFHNSPTSKPDEVRAVWISYLEMDTLLKNKSAAQFRKNIGEVFDNVTAYNLNTVVVQVRPFGDALYPSEYFPWSYVITGTEGKDPGFDPLAIMLEEAKKRNLRFEAWINPYRVRAAGNTKALCADNQAQKWLNAQDRAVISYNGMVSYNPASSKARTHIVDGVRELVRNYDIDAIHIDDYFYPTTDLAFDQADYNAYRKNGGTLSHADWRRSNVEKLVQSIYQGVKAENPNVLFGISPQGNLDINYHGQYFDAKKMLATSGYCDYICPQVYYGFDNASQPFTQVVQTWNNLVKSPDVDLYIGIAVYKVGVQDNYAGTGKNEWKNKTTMLQEMVETSRGMSNYNGFVLYRYDSLFRPAASVQAQVNKESNNLRRVLS